LPSVATDSVAKGSYLLTSAIYNQLALVTKHINPVFKSIKSARIRLYQWDKIRNLFIEMVGIYEDLVLEQEGKFQYDPSHLNKISTRNTTSKETQ
jgi:DNA helicase IV